MKLAMHRIGWGLLALVLLALFALLTWEPFFAEQPGKAPPARHYSA